MDESAPRAQLVGYSCRWRVTDEVHLLNVAVHQGRRGGGIGRRLVEAVIDEARETRARTMFLEVRAGNVAARRLYRHLGFRDLGVRRGYYGPGQDAIVMELRLDDRDRCRRHARLHRRGEPADPRDRGVGNVRVRARVRGAGRSLRGRARSR